MTFGHIRFQNYVLAGSILGPPEHSSAHPIHHTDWKRQLPSCSRHKHLSESWRMIESQGLPEIHSCQSLTKHSSTTPPFRAAGCALHTHNQVLNSTWPPGFMMSCSSARPPLGKTDTANDSLQGIVSTRQGCQWPTCYTFMTLTASADSWPRTGNVLPWRHTLSSSIKIRLRLHWASHCQLLQHQHREHQQNGRHAVAQGNNILKYRKKLLFRTFWTSPFWTAETPQPSCRVNINQQNINLVRHLTVEAGSTVKLYHPT